MKMKYNINPDAPALKHYREFVRSHRRLAFGRRELTLRQLLNSGEMNLLGKGKHLTKKILQHYMNQQAIQFQHLT
jgi:hypothetical protein